MRKCEWNLHAIQRPGSVTFLRRAIVTTSCRDWMKLIRKRPGIPLACALLSFCATASVASAGADSVVVTSRRSDSLEWMPFLAPNSEEEIYVRYLQIAGTVPKYPWTLRGFSPGEATSLVARIGSHPWTRSGQLTSREQRARLIPLTADVRANSAFPYGSNDGPTWAGRGLTATGMGGVLFDGGPISLVLAPTAFLTQNASFELLNNGRSGDERFGDGLRSNGVDRPQRFGDKTYGRMDPGNSTLRLDLGPVAVGVSSANVAWGPMEQYPFVIGTNAPGFSHGFLGTSTPVGIWIGRLHWRAIWGRLDQTSYSVVDGSPTYVSPSEPGTRRFGSGLIAILEPQWTPGLELGIARFFHSPWPRAGIPSSYFTKPFGLFFKDGVTNPSDNADNQLISGFARWVFPSAGLELYGEYGREDHSWDKRDFVQEPDHSRSYGLGFRKALSLNSTKLDGLTVELINFQLPHLARTGRGEGGIYVHGVLRQGHTNRGQLLGTDVGVGSGAGSLIRWDRYRSAGRTSFSLMRIVRQEKGEFYNFGAREDRSSDVQYVADLTRMRRYGRLEITTGIALVHEFNRNFGKDATNVSLQLKMRFPLTRYAPSVPANEVKSDALGARSQ